MPPPDPTRTTLKEWFAFLCMVFGMFMAILDIQIVSSSISEIQAGLSASPDEVAWVQTSYLIAEIVMIPLSGWLSRLLSTRILFVISAVGFTVCSMLCAWATTLNAMIAFRALQGFLGGAMIPTVFATAWVMFPGQRSAKVSVLIGLIATMAPTFGPTLGGWLTETFSWHMLFLINVPFGIGVAISVWLLLDLDKPNFALFKSFDYLGLLLMAAFLGSLEYVLEDGNQNDWFQDSTITAFAVLSAVSGVAFIHRMLTRRDPLVELRAFKNANFTAGCLFSLVLGTGLYGATFVVPVFLGRVRGYDSLQIGQAMFVTGALQFVSAPIVANLIRVIDVRRMLALGLAMFGVAVWWLSHLTSQVGFWDIAAPQALRGFALMFIMLPTNQLALGTLPPDQVKNASGIYNLMRNLGGAFGLAAINTLASVRTDVHALHLKEALTWSHASSLKGLHTITQGLTSAKQAAAPLAALRKLAAMVQQQAMTLAYNDVLLVMSAVFLLALPFTLLLAKPKPMGAGGGAH